LWLVVGNLVTFARSFEWMFTDFFNCMLWQRWCQCITVSAVSGLGGDTFIKVNKRRGLCFCLQIRSLFFFSSQC
jgi:hypothetical protein